MIKYTDLPDEVKLAEDEDDKKKGRRIETDEELARILSVDREAWTVHAQPEGDDHIITDVPMLSMYEHVDGSGIYFLPRRGARGLLVYYDRGGPRFLCYRWTN